jgi:citrate synthase
MSPAQTPTIDEPTFATMPETLTITDNRTGKQYDVAIKDGTIKATDLRQIKAGADDPGLMTYDPAFMNTAACYSRITFIDGDKGILEYRGYPIEQLAERASHLEVAYLLMFGELPTTEQLADWTDRIHRYLAVPPSIQDLITTFATDAHPMGVFQSAVAALSTCYPEAKAVADEAVRRRQEYRLLACTPTLAAYGYRHAMGLPCVEPDASLSFTENFLRMLFKGEGDYHVNPVLARALDVLFILHADHEQNCSTSTMRNVGSSHADPYASAASALGALYGPLHGGANEAVLRMLAQIGTVDRVPEFIKQVKSHQALLMGFGHRIYKSYDPRARIIKKTADQVFAVTGLNPLLEIAVELERIALQDEYFVSRKLYPNVDFYSGLIYQAMGIPSGMFTVLFGIGRTAGWLAQWDELVQDPDQKIARPRQIYVGPTRRDFVPIAERG